MNKPKDFAFLQSVPEKVKTIFTNYHGELDKARKINSVAVDANSQEIKLAADKFSADQKKAKTDSLTALSDLLSQVNAREQQAQKEIDQALGFRADSENVQENLLRETRERAAWDRLKPLLDREDEFTLPKALGALIKDFALASDKDSISVIRKELPIYLRSRFPKTDILPEAVDTFERTLSATSPEATEALTFQSELRTGVYQLRMAISYAQYAIEHDELTFVMTLWEKGQTIMVTQKGSAEKPANGFRT